MPWGRGWHKHKRGLHKHGRRKHWGLRRRLTFTFAFVALAAVALTTWLTLGAVFSAQQELFPSAEAPFRPQGREHFDWNDEGFAGSREAFRRITRTSFFAGLLAFFLASGVAGFVTRRLTRPLAALTDGARRLAAGERELRLQVPSSRDELRTLTEAFNSLVSGLERQERWRRDMVADIAHDLRTPLSVLRSELEGMQDGVVALDEASVTRLHGEVMNLSRLVEDLRTLSLAESGGLTLELGPVQIAPFLERLTSAFKVRAEEVGVDLALLVPLPDISVTADAERLARALGNLLDNAFRYASPGRVELGARRLGDELELRVRDHGPGLDEGKLEQIFERFYRGDAARTARDSSGLGLAIARAIAEAHGGGLEAANAEGGGALFTLSLPLSQNE